MNESSSPTALGELDRYLFAEGTHRRVHDVLGGHLDGDGRARFAVWAPNARAVDLVGDMVGWDHGRSMQRHHADSGIWEVEVDGAGAGQHYMLRVHGSDGRIRQKADPFAAGTALPPAQASRLVDLDDGWHRWHDDEWMGRRGHADRPVSIYEVHLGSWRAAADHRRWPCYEDLGDALARYVLERGFTHVELLPVSEHPFYGSWGYQTTGYFAPTARNGTPRGFAAMVDRLHQAGIGVILDWVPSHFPTDEFGLHRFDGTALYEHADPRRGHQPDWDTAIFDYGRNEVRSFLLSSAMCWIERYHVDGLRVDAVASMLYLDYSRRHGEWQPNEHGGREHLEAIDFLRRLNDVIGDAHPDVMVIAEESTAWPGVTNPTAQGGLGFTSKWDMGWMHDALAYFEREPIDRSWHHHELTFRSMYATSERFTLPLSHDEVVHLKGSLLAKMPGDDWQRFANLRALLGWQWATPGAKLLFMGGELAVPTEWNHESALAWDLLDVPAHRGMADWVTELNRLLAEQPSLWRDDDRAEGFRWIVADDTAQSVYCWLRSAEGSPPVLVCANLTPLPRHPYAVGVPAISGESSETVWRLVANSDDARFGGSGFATGDASTTGRSLHGLADSLELSLPPLSVTMWAP